MNAYTILYIKFTKRKNVYESILKFAWTIPCYRHHHNLSLSGRTLLYPPPLSWVPHHLSSSRLAYCLSPPCVHLCSRRVKSTYEGAAPSFAVKPSTAYPSSRVPLVAWVSFIYLSFKVQCGRRFGRRWSDANLVVPRVAMKVERRGLERKKRRLG